MPLFALSESLASDLKGVGSKLGCSVLCPGFVQTRILDAARNRPSEFGPASSAEEEGLEGMRALVAQGMKPDDVSDVVFDAIESDDFYILPHTAWDDMVRERFDRVLARGPALVPDPGEIQRKLEAGDQL